MGLKRTLYFKDSYLLLFTSIVGSGIFFTTGFILKFADHPFSVIITWIIGGLFALTGGLSYAYPAVIYPHAGGDYVYLKKAYSPLLAFLSGWASLTANFSANIAVLSLAFAKHLFFIFPSISINFFKIKLGIFELYFGSAQIIGLLLIWGFTLLNLRGVKYALSIQNFLSILKISGIILFIILGFSIGNLDFSRFQFQQSNLPFSYGDFEFNFKLISNIASAVVPVSFAYLGWNMVTYVAEEINEPSKNIPRSVTIACLSVIVLYSLINILYLASSNGNQLIDSKEGVGVTASINLFGENAKFIMSSFIIVMVLGSIPAMIFAGSRIYFAMSRDGLFFRSLSEIHPKYETPYKSLIFQAFYSSILLLFNDIEKLLYFITSAILIMSIFTAMIPIKLKKEKIKSDYEIPFFPIPPLFYIVGNIFILIVLTLNSPSNTIIGIGITFSGIPVYLLLKRTFRKKK